MRPIPPKAWPFIVAFGFGALVVLASLITPQDSQTPTFTLLGTLAGYVLGKHS